MKSLQIGLSQPTWNPYVAGGLTGVVLGASAWLSGKLFGTTDAITKATGLIEQSFVPDHVAKNDYFQLNTPEINWQSTFVLGIFFGSLISAVSTNRFRWRTVPTLWRERYGYSPVKRLLAALIGGIVAMFGARMAKGCPSGQMGGIIQLSLGSLIAMISFFVGGIVMSNGLYQGGKQA